MKDIPVRKINASLKGENFSESFSIRNVRDFFSGKNMIQEIHRHDFFYILALEKGKGNHEIDFNSYRVRNHTVFIIRPGQVHSLELKAGSTGFLIAFKTDFYNSRNNGSNILRTAASKNVYQFNAREFKKLDSILNYIFQEYNTKQDRYHDVIKANLDILFIEITRHRRNDKSASSNSNLYTQERLDEFLELLETHLTEHKQASEYADKLNLSPYQLNAITKTMLNKTCSEVIDEYIILESKRYLLATSKQVNQIAYSLGYEDVSYFIRFFKKHTGYTPEVFRNNYR
jgi:AraC family transcriptional regulator, transcriptional activator of pobA